MSLDKYHSCFDTSSEMLLRILKLIVALHVLVDSCNCARILAVFPTMTHSHQVVFQKLTIELSKRGHEFVIFTPDPAYDPELKNYTEIDLSHTVKLLPTVIETNGDNFNMWKGWSIVAMTYIAEYLSHPEMQRLITPNSGEKFDLILSEYLIFDAINGLATRFDAPIVGIVALPLTPSLHYSIGNPSAWAYAPGIFDEATDHLNFWGRLNTAYRGIRFQLVEYFYSLPGQEELLKKYFGPDYPSASEHTKNASILLVNSHPALTYPRPNLPGVIEIGGITSIGRKCDTLDPELKEFLDGATNGFIYFSLGSHIKSVQLPAEKMNALRSAFAELPYKVLWKWEEDILPEKPRNVLTKKWLTQCAVLAHPNIKVFMYQGGIQSTEEAVYSAVPLVGIPVFADQEYNIRKIMSVGAGERLDLSALSKDDIKNTLIKVINNRSYKTNMLKLRDLFIDQPQTPLERAVWWTEYVIRHKGAPHLRTRVRHLFWYERENLDILVFAISTVLMICYLFHKLLYFIIRYAANTLNVSQVMKLKNN